jgi:NTE family protein
MSGRPGRKGGAILGLAGPRAEKTVALALQGGGAHGAFTWGVLDALIEDGRLAFEAVTGASAGAMNAVVMVEGWLEGGPDGARNQLETFWKRVSLDGNLSNSQRVLFDKFLGYWSGQIWTDLWSRVASPYETNPLNINPLRDLLNELIDFERVRDSGATKLYVAATNVWTGKGTVFDGATLTADHVMASACLPTVFQAVEIEGVPYWDGGYGGNPPLYPLFYGAKTDDILLVQVNPVERRETPHTAQEINNRLNEITFNAGLLRELRAVDFVAELIDAGKLSKDEYKRVLMHRIDGTGVLDDLEASSKLNAEWNFFQRLRDAGRATAQRWLEKHYDSIGREATLDLPHLYQ